MLVTAGEADSENILFEVALRFSKHKSRGYFGCQPKSYKRMISAIRIPPILALSIPKFRLKVLYEEMSLKMCADRQPPKSDHNSSAGVKMR